MARELLTPQLRALGWGGLALGMVIAALGTWGPLFKGQWLNGMVPVNVLGGALAVMSLILLIVGPARRRS